MNTQKGYTFSETGISLNQILSNIGILTIEKAGKKYLQFEGKEIPRPPVQYVEKQVKEHFGIDITYTK